MRSHARRVCDASTARVILPLTDGPARGVTMPRTSAPKSAEGQTETTASVQDYLAAVYDLAGSGKPVIGARLAKHMNISAPAVSRSEEHTSELESRENLVCRLLLEKKKT